MMVDMPLISGILTHTMGIGTQKQVRSEMKFQPLVLRDAAKIRGLRLREISIGSKASIGTVWNLMNGKTRNPGNVLDRVCKILGISREECFVRESETEGAGK